MIRRRTWWVLPAAALACLGALPGLAGALVTLEQTRDSATVRASHCAVVLDTTAGGRLRAFSADGRPGLEFSHDGLWIVEERDRPQWTKAHAPSPTTHQEVDSQPRCRFERRDDALLCISEWACPAGSVTRTLWFADGMPGIGVRYRAHITSPVEQLAYRLASRDGEFFTHCRFYPGDGERVLSLGGETARHTPTPSLAYLYDGRTGFGLTAGVTEGISAIAHTIEPGANRVQIDAYGPPLRWTPVPYDVEMSFRVVLGPPPANALELHRTTAPRLDPVEIVDLEVDRLILRPDEEGTARVTVSNNTAQPRHVRLFASVDTGIAGTIGLPEQSLELRPAEFVQVPVQWQRLGEGGFGLQVRLLAADGALLDRAVEYFAVADNFSRVGQMVVYNPGWMNQDWQVDRQIELARENCVGTIEYCCWAPDQVYDLTPDTEQFEPHTESQAAYTASLTRSFLQALIRRAHDNGLRVLAMGTGLASLQGAREHPEQMMYTPDGQMYLHSGALHDGRRYNAVGAHVFTPERITAWANEMAASVDMFGWDGVRFDWNFFPLSPQDPLHLGDAAAGDDAAWHDWQGRSARDLFADPDATAAELCRLWRDTVAQRHPRFVYHGSMTVDEAVRRRLPRYTETVCAGSDLLHEALSDVTVNYPTWREWAEALTNSTRVIRPLGGQPSVGLMRGYAPGSVAHRVMQYCMMAAGFHWYGDAGARHSIDDTWFRLRHAMRFSDYFYGQDFIPMADPAQNITVSGRDVDRVLWEPFAYAREVDGRTETLIHLVNLPQSDYIIQRHELPSVKRDLSVSTAVPNGQRVTACHLLVPDPEPHAEAIEFAPDGDGHVTCRIPELRQMGSLVVQSEVD